MAGLKCWFAGSKRPSDYDFVECVFALSHREAKKLAWQKGDRIGDACDGDYMNLTVSRRKQFDHLAAGNEPYVLTDGETLRKMGWMMEDDLTCQGCGLAAYGDLHPVCEECEKCDECGHNDDCPEREKEE